MMGGPIPAEVRARMDQDRAQAEAEAYRPLSEAEYVEFQSKLLKTAHDMVTQFDRIRDFQRQLSTAQAVAPILNPTLARDAQSAARIVKAVADAIADCRGKLVVEMPSRWFMQQRKEVAKSYERPDEE